MTHASIFSGIGGAELAAAWMGWTNLFHCEIQDFPRQVLDYWFPDSISYGDITRTNFEQWNGKVDVLTGGFPCQPFSLAGQRRGADDNRYLWPEMLRAIREINPTWVVGENVTGIKTMVESCEEIKVGRTDDLFEENYIYREESWFTLEKSARNLTQQDIQSNRLLFQLVPSELPTEEIVSGLLPTIQTQGLKRCNRKGKTEFLPLELLPTPTALDKGTGRTNKSLSPNAAERPTLALAAKQGLLPTPCASEATKFTKKLNFKSQMGKSLTAMACNGMIPAPSSKR